MKIIHLRLLLCLFMCTSLASIHAQTDLDDQARSDLALRVQNRGILNLSQENLRVHSSHISSTSGVYHVYMYQTHNNIDINGTQSSIHYSKSQEVFKVNDNLLFSVNTRGDIATLPSVNMDDAFRSVASDFDLNYQGIEEVTSELSRPGDEGRYIASSIAIGEIVSKFLYFRNADNSLELSYDILFEEPNSSFLWTAIVSSETGELLYRRQETLECNFGHESKGAGHVHTHDCISAHSNVEPLPHSQNVSNPDSYNVFPMPFFSAQDAGYTSSVVVNPAEIVASPFGWHDTDGAVGAEFTNTRGNNVYAQDDINGNDGFGASPNGGANLDFLSAYDHGVEPRGSQANQDAAITNLFYWNNIMHDVWYQYGFDEVGGNFQENNYGRGGAGSDYVIADALDGSFTNNAFFTPATDGNNPRIEMFEWVNGPYNTPGSANTARRTGDLDNGIIAHEYGHGISFRLAGGANTIGCLGSSEQAGEGWSDWFGLVMTIKPGDVGSMRRGVGTYALNQALTGGGIRRYPYSTDFGINPHTYADIASENVPHGVGSVFCAMLWEMTWELIGVYGFDPDVYNGAGGNNIAMALVIEGLKLQPCNPGFVDMRDAILAADVALYNGANQCYIWDAFARRGLGLSASQGSPNNNSDGTEAYDVPNSSALAFTKTASASSVPENGNIVYTLTVSNPNNACSLQANNVVICDPVPAKTTFVSATGQGTLSGGNVIFPSVNLAPGQSQTVSFTVAPNAGTGGVGAFLDDVENGNIGWTTSSTTSLGTWSISTNRANSPTRSWFANDYSSPNDQFLTSDPFVPASGCEMIFWHDFDTEVNWDGGLVEYSTDGGSTWLSLGSLMTQNGYNGVLDDNNNTPGFSGDSGGFIETKIDLSSLVGQCIQVRFLMHCDPFVGGVGWNVDDIQFTSIESVVNNTASIKINGVDGGEASSKPTIITEVVCPSCYVNLSHRSACGLNTLETGIVDYESSSWIQLTSPTVIQAGAKVDYDAVDYILIDRSFTVQSGAEWNAFIDGCNGGSGGINLKENPNDNIQQENKSITTKDKESTSQN